MSDKDFFLGPLSTAPAQAQKAVGSLIPVAEGSEPLVLHIPAGTHYSDAQPIRVADAASHVCIVLENGAQADVAIILEGSVTAHTIEVIITDEAQCTVLTMNMADGPAVTIAQQSQVGAGAHMRWQNVTLGMAAVEHSLTSRVAGHDGESSIEWMSYAKGNEKQQLTVRNIFDATNGTGEILMRGIAENKGHTVCKGMIDIGLQGGGTNTYLTQEVLMLDASSKVDAIPALEIKTNDVKASHSATIARVTEEDLFYFGARGISPHEARRMFVLGFLGDITQRITDEPMREIVIAAIETKYQR